jgi:hypothetical protein
MKTAAEPVPSTKAPLILLLCAFAVPVLTGFMGTDGSKIHPATLAAWPPECNDRTPDCSTSCLENKYGDLVIERVCRDGDIEPVFGDFSWRYFQRGIFEGARLSGLRYFFRPWLGYEQGNYADRLLDPLNPTPFLITLFLVAAAWIIGVYERRLARQKREDEVTALHI